MTNTLLYDCEVMGPLPDPVTGAPYYRAIAREGRFGDGRAAGIYLEIAPTPQECIALVEQRITSATGLSYRARHIAYRLGHSSRFQDKEKNQ